MLRGNRKKTVSAPSQCVHWRKSLIFLRFSFTLRSCISFTYILGIVINRVPNQLRRLKPILLWYLLQRLIIRNKDANWWHFELTAEEYLTHVLHDVQSVLTTLYAIEDSRCMFSLKLSWWIRLFQFFRFDFFLLAIITKVFQKYKCSMI